MRISRRSNKNIAVGGVVLAVAALTASSILVVVAQGATGEEANPPASPTNVCCTGNASCSSDDSGTNDSIASNTTYESSENPPKDAHHRISTTTNPRTTSDSSTTGSSERESSLQSTLEAREFKEAAASDSTNECDECGLYLAESTIPNSGWGLFAGTDIPRDQPLRPLDLAISVFDHVAQMDLQNRLLQQQHGMVDASAHYDLPPWLLRHYLWTASLSYCSYWEANRVKLLLPGAGMLLNSLTGAGQVNIRNDGPLSRQRWTDRSNPWTGSATHLYQQRYTTKRNVLAGEELLVEYGDDYFIQYADDIGPVPLSTDYRTADHILDAWQSATDGSKQAQQVWEKLVVGAFMTHVDRRLQMALPGDYAQAVQALQKGGAAALQTDQRRRSLDFLKQHGMCMDLIETTNQQQQQSEQQDDKNPNHGRGAFARCALKSGQRVMPIPVVQMSRRHLILLTVDEHDEILWKGHQLLLNYCYGHPLSSLLFFPSAPGVNFIHHSNSPNVALRWSDRMPHPELLNQTVRDVLEFPRAGLMMELYALRDINAEEEMLLSYGNEWQSAWDAHMQHHWRRPVHAHDYQSSYDYEKHGRVPTLDKHNKDANDDTLRYPPSYIQVLCWVDLDALSSSRVTPDHEGWHSWPGTAGWWMHLSHPCRVESEEDDEAVKDDKQRHFFYRIVVEDTRQQTEWKVKRVPRDAVTFTEAPYTSNQALRQGFRHEIQLPDEMVPENWKDLADVGDDNAATGLFQSFNSTLMDKSLMWLKTKDEMMRENATNDQSILTDCFVGFRGNRINQDGGESDELPSFQWQYYKGIYSDIAFSFPCDVLKREDAVDLVQAYNRADSISPLDVRYTVLVYQGDVKGQAIYTDVPRKAIRWIDC